MEEKTLGTGQRHNDGKLKYDLINPQALEGLVKVLTAGSLKYEDHNWEYGMEWSKVIGCLKRHLAAIEKGKDYDFDPTCEACKAGTCTNHTGELHADLLQTNAHFLSAYYRIYPQGDNRFSLRRPKPKIGLDVDEVLCSWVDGYKEKYGYKDDHYFNSWYLHYKIKERCNTELDNDFYLNLKPKTNPKDIPFEPHCYITSRHVPTEVTQEWLYKNGFPCMPVYTIGLNDSKVETIRKAGCDIFVDDTYKNYCEINEAGLCCYLFDAPHNQRYDVGYRRIKSLKELKF